MMQHKNISLFAFQLYSAYTACFFKPFRGHFKSVEVDTQFSVLSKACDYLNSLISVKEYFFQKYVVFIRNESTDACHFISSNSSGDLKLFFRGIILVYLIARELLWSVTPVYIEKSKWYVP